METRSLHQRLIIFQEPRETTAINLKFILKPRLENIIYLLQSPLAKLLSNNFSCRQQIENKDQNPLNRDKRKVQNPFHNVKTNLITLLWEIPRNKRKEAEPLGWMSWSENKKGEAKQGSWTDEGCCSSASTEDKGVNTTTQQTVPDTARSDLIGCDIVMQDNQQSM